MADEHGFPDGVVRHEASEPDRQAAATARAEGAARKGLIRDPSVRPGFDAIMAAVPAADGVRYEEAELAGVRGWWCRPQAASGGRRLLFVHGGGYVVGSAQAFRPFVGQLAARLAADAFVPDYRLAPEHPFPAAIDDVRAVYGALAGTGGPLALAGDSAGGGLVLALLSQLRGEGVALPAAAAVMSPWTDLSISGASVESRAAADPIFTREAVTNLARLYLDGADPRDPRASPLFADKAGLPPIRIDVGDDEILLDDSLRYAAAAREAGVEVEVHVWLGMPHVVPNKIAGFDAARQSLAGLCAFLDDQLEPGDRR